MLDRLGALIVDTDCDHLRHCRELLERLNYTVFAASSAEAALMLVHGGQRLALALIAADLGDGVTGFDVGESLGRLGMTKKILFMSAVPLDQERFLLKPVIAEELAAILH